MMGQRSPAWAQWKPTHHASGGKVSSLPVAFVKAEVESLAAQLAALALK